ncbi:MAG TPA: hypothetical protein VEK73_01665 [Xanthobacteraceae bacterium]|nr:hypothetical protein [Xanthobacteraceae bacterium]
MATRYLPRLSEADHDALRDQVHRYPAGSYDVWLKLQAEEIADWETDGGKVILVDVSADDFARYCRDTGARRDIHTLRGIAAAKGTQKFK